MSLGDQIAFLVSFLLTILVLSYLLGDNPLFRLALHLFIGAAAGYAGAVALRDVLLPTIWTPLVDSVSGGGFQGLALVIPPLLLGLLLLAKLSPRLAWMGNPTMAYLVGVGAAAAIGGSVLGTLFPQIASTFNLFDLEGAQAAGITAAERLVEGSIVLAGTVMTLMYFHFGVRTREGQSIGRSRWIELLSWGGQVFLAITFGVLFAGVYAAALTALIERLTFLWDLRLLLANFL